MRIGLVNDVKLAIEALRRVMVSLPDAEVAWIAEDGQQAIEKCRADRPDVILMDLIMPVTDGVEATRKIMQQSPCPILVVTATVTGNCSKVYEALGHGALDAVNTPVLGRDGSVSGGEELVRKIRNVMKLQCGKASGLDIPATGQPPPTHAVADRSVPLVVIGASTGGPQAIAEVFASLPRPLPYSVVVVQHLDPLFVPGLAEWLAHDSGLTVQLIEPGQKPNTGTVYLACTPDHLVLSKTLSFQYVREPAELAYRPSVDVFFDSLLKAAISPGVAVLLTGMGRDGAAGLRALREAGWETIAQDEATSIVWGMPGAAVRLDAASHVLPLKRIGAAITAATTTSANAE